MLRLLLLERAQAGSGDKLCEKRFPGKLKVRNAAERVSYRVQVRWSYDLRVRSKLQADAQAEAQAEAEEKEKE